jgi:serine phosphatase RsbU (regulator of sigma subunit)
MKCTSELYEDPRGFEMDDLESILADLIRRINEGERAAFDSLARLLGFLSTFFLMGSGVGLHGTEAADWVQNWIVTVIASTHTATKPYLTWLEHEFERFVHGEFFQNVARLQMRIMCELPPLPPRVRAHAVIRPRQRVSGDLILSLRSDAEILFAVGDVTSHGTAAALYGALALQLLQTAWIDAGVQADDRPLVAAARKLNREILRSKIGHIALPIILSRVLPQKSLVEILNCGSPAKPFLLRNGSTMEIGGGGPALGYFDEPTLDVWRHTWEADDILVLPTDGLVEQTNSAGDMYTNERLAQTLNSTPSLEPSEVAGHVFQAIDLFAAGFEQSDDQSLLVIHLGD